MTTGDQTGVAGDPRPGADELVRRARDLTPVFSARAAKHDAEGSFPFENFEDLFEAGLLTLAQPVERGGHGAGLETIARVVQAVAEGDAATALVLQMNYMPHLGLGGAGRWPNHLYDMLCRDSLERLTLVNSARVEPELGTPARGGLPATTAAKTAAGWRLNGHKIYTTGSPLLRYAIVWAKTDEDPLRVGGFVLPMDLPGVRIEETWDHIGLRASGSHDLILEDVELPAGYEVDLREPEGWISTTPPTARQQTSGCLMAALYHGVAVAARNWTIDYTQRRVPTNLGAPLSSLPRFQAALGEIDLLLFTNERLIYGTLADIAAGRPVPPTAGGNVKHIVTTNAVRAAKTGLDLLGNPGLSRHNPLERLYRDALCGPVHSPQGDTVLMNAGKAALRERPVE